MHNIEYYGKNLFHNRYCLFKLFHIISGGLLLKSTYNDE